MAKKRLLVVGDAACSSGFARSLHEIIDGLKDQYDVTVLGVNYRGDPHPYPYPIYAAAPGGDTLGIGRLIWMCDLVKPDLIIIQTDGWFVPYYMNKLRARKPTGEYAWPEYAALPVVAIVAVDGRNFQGAWLKGVTSAVFWTGFALREARLGGYTGSAAVIPLGVDTKTFYPVPKHEALERQKAGVLKDKFIVGNVNRNQPRKRWDLTIRYFSEWVHSRNAHDAQLFLHSAPTGDESVNIQELAQYYRVLDKLALVQPEAFYGKHDDDMRDTYNCFDVSISTTQGEGMGLTTLEAMACNVACVVPEYAALGDWAKGAAAMVPCTSYALQSPGLSVIGGVVDEKAFIEALDLLYRDKDHRKMVADFGLQRAREKRFSWDHIRDQWSTLVRTVLAPPKAQGDEIWKELNPAEEAVK